MIISKKNVANVKWIFGIYWCYNTPIPVITVLFIKPVDFVHIKEWFYKKNYSLLVSCHASAKWWGWSRGLGVWQQTCELCSTVWIWYINVASLFCIPNMIFMDGKSLECHCYKNLKYLTNKKVWITTTNSMEFLWAVDASTGVQGTNILLFADNSGTHPQHT